MRTTLMAAILAAILSNTCSACQGDSGIEGSVVLGPLCPAERPGMVCSKPLAAAIDVVRPDGTNLTVIHSAKDGSFRVCAPAGKYKLVPERLTGEAAWPRGVPQEVIVAARRFSHVVMNYDTGIR